MQVDMNTAMKKQNQPNISREGSDVYDFQIKSFRSMAFKRMFHAKKTAPLVNCMANELRYVLKNV